jgi:hypothetical protein
MAGLAEFCQARGFGSLRGKLRTLLFVSEPRSEVPLIDGAAEYDTIFHDFNPLLKSYFTAKAHTT